MKLSIQWTKFDILTWLRIGLSFLLFSWVKTVDRGVGIPRFLNAMVSDSVESQGKSFFEENMLHLNDMIIGLRTFFH